MYDNTQRVWHKSINLFSLVSVQNWPRSPNGGNVPVLKVAFGQLAQYVIEGRTEPYTSFEFVVSFWFCLQPICRLLVAPRLVAWVINVSLTTIHAALDQERNVNCLPYSTNQSKIQALMHSALYSKGWFDEALQSFDY
jgi:hypothetical protein